MKKTTKIVFIVCGVFFLIYWLLSTIFTVMTFDEQFEIHEDEHLVYKTLEQVDCNVINSHSKDLKIKFSYKYPFVNFKGKLEIFDKNDTISNPDGKILFSGKYKDNIVIKNVCYLPKNKESWYKDLEFRFSDEDAVYWFYSNTKKQGYPFLKYDEIEIKIDWFSIHPSMPYHIIPIE